MKPLKILLANATLALLAGSETWTEALAIQLKKMGHDVEAFSPSLGVISDRLELAGIKCYAEMSPSGIRPFSYALEEERRYDYDVIIANHNHIVDFLRSQFPKTPIISTVHGIIHFTQNEAGERVKAPEHPALEASVGQFVSVSEEVQEILKKDFNLDSMIIRNFINLKQYKAKRKISKGKPKAFLINTNYAGSADPDVDLIRRVAKDHYGAKVMAVGMNFQSTADTMPMIEEADVVVGMGRSVLEGAAAGRLAIVNGRWGTGGVINQLNVNELRSCNFSGRNSGGRYMTSEELIAEIDKDYNPETIDWVTNYIKSEHNVVHAAEVFVQTARGLIAQPEVTEPVLRPYRRARDVDKKDGLV